jgi:hypothetical protein
MAPDGLGLFEGDVGVELVFQQPLKGRPLAFPIDNV